MAIHKGNLVKITDESIVEYFNLTGDEIFLVIRSPYESITTTGNKSTRRKPVYTSLIKAVDLMLSVWVF